MDKLQMVQILESSGIIWESGNKLEFVKVLQYSGQIVCLQVKWSIQVVRAKWFDTSGSSQVVQVKWFRSS